MISVAEASALIDAHLNTIGTEPVPLTEAAGRVLAERIAAERDQPPFDRATMDGIAIASSSSLREFDIVGAAPAGAPRQTLPGNAATLEIMTGAPLPAGADCIVPVEQTDSDGTRVRLQPDAQVTAGRFVHALGSDHRRGDTLLETGQRLRGPEIAVLASAGKAKVEVFRPPRVAIVSGGDELADLGEPVAPHQIRRSNDYAIEAALRLAGVRDTCRALVRDDVAEQTRVLGELLDSNDLLVLSGGVSMGRFDTIPQVLDNLGVKTIFHRVAQRPGKPMWFGVAPAGQPVFALPGNPVSALVCCRRYVEPAIAQLLGERDSEPLRDVALTERVKFEAPLTWFLPAKTVAADAGRVTPRPTNTSGDFAALAGTDGFIELPAEAQEFPAGFAAPWYPW